jgi:hypothetical protein
MLRINGLDSGGFPTSHELHFEFEDGSFAQFAYALYVVDEKKEAIAVFTEHCGYHIFFLLRLWLFQLPLGNRSAFAEKNGKVNVSVYCEGIVADCRHDMDGAIRNFFCIPANTCTARHLSANIVPYSFKLN